MISRQGLRAVKAWLKGQHAYYSTGCRHGRHTYCQGKEGRSGPKKPGQCKFCAAKCGCPCHKEASDVAP
jgi:hypothetical protein